ncbi:MAG: RsmB/NOP family class I SAM-dependent RNA methyltransferase [Sphaerochaetaceae bacterium]|nr:RsmB/NOP family class I SAM-dependent RNA methyltransferase [Sphaerochaetaceae bacterium]
MGKTREKVSFDAYYRKIYEDRWEGLQNALLSDPQQIPLDDRDSPYYLDEASVIAAQALPVSPGSAVLDMCAAPGGKSLILSRNLGATGTLVCNDRSSQRRARLHRVLDQYTPVEVRSRIRITSHDASRWALYETDQYDSILLDAPCSSERHVLRDPSAIAAWSVSRTRNLQSIQFAMLASALEAVKIGGHILYSTCSINPHENQDVAHRLEKKRSGRYRFVDTELLRGEYCDPGVLILPDSEENIGPIYYVLIQRTA